MAKASVLSSTTPPPPPPVSEEQLEKLTRDTRVVRSEAEKFVANLFMSDTQQKFITIK